MDAIPAPDWRYEMRRLAQEIVPGLFIGPYQSGTKREELRRLGITDILVISSPIEAHLLKARFTDEFNYKILEVRDAMDQNLIRDILPEASAFINQGLSRPGRVLVHCGDGISRSPAIVCARFSHLSERSTEKAHSTAYVMQTFNVTHEKAFEHVQARRFCVSPNMNFNHQLEAYQYIHQAKMAIAKDQNAGQRDNVRRKRPEESDDEDELERDQEAQRIRDFPPAADTVWPVAATVVNNDAMDMS